MAEYVHRKLGRIAGSYVREEYPSKEIVVEVGGRKVLAFQNKDIHTHKPKSVVVPGYILNYQARTNADGLKVSDIELITDSAERAAVEKEIFRKELEGFINFWT